MIRSKQKTSSTCKALDNKKAAVKVGTGSEQRAQANEQAVEWTGRPEAVPC